MELTVKERLHLLFVLRDHLPPGGDVLTLRITRKLLEALSFTEEEHALYKPVTDKGTVSWNPDAPQAREIEIGEKAKEVVAKAITAAGEKGESGPLRMEFLPLYDKFVPEE